MPADPRPPLIRAFGSMRLIDQYLGPPICVALGLVKRLSTRFRRRTNATAGGPPSKVLVIKFWGMGSIVLMTPALRALKRAYPDCHVTFLTFAPNESVCRMIRTIDRVYAYRADGPLAFLASFAALVRFLRRERFDVVLDLEFFANFTAVVTALSGAPTTVGFHTPKFWRASFYTHRVSYDHTHISGIFMKAVRSLGVEADGAELDPLVVADAAVERALDGILSQRGVPSTCRLVCVNVNASALDYKRRWPLQSYRELLRRILDEFPDVALVLIGAPDEAPYVAMLTQTMPSDPRLLDLCGAIDLRQLVLLLQRSDLFVGNDSGPLHVAAAAGIPTVSFFGPETPALYGPRGSGHAVLYKNIPCSPCLNVYNSKDNSSCHNNICMQVIGVDEAWAAVRARLAESAPRWSTREAEGGR